MFYNYGMEKLPLIPYANKLCVLVAPHHRSAGMLEVVASLALRGSLRVFDGGNHFNVLVVARSLRRSTVRVEQLLERIFIARAFTCHQMESMLGSAPDVRYPTLVIDLLNTFYDESVRDAESHGLLLACIQHLKRLSQHAPVIVSAGSSLKPGSRTKLVEALLDASDLAWELELAPEKNPQTALWS